MTGMTEAEFQHQLAQERQARRQAEQSAAEKSREIHQLTQQLAEAREQALEASRATSTFLANMSHELRTPLNAIIGYSDILEEEAQQLDRDDFIFDLHLIKSAGKHLQAVISDILALTKIESGQMDLDLDTFDLVKLVQEVMTTVQLMVNQNGNTLEVNCDDTIGVMQADMSKVQQILFNLLGNAAKFTQQGHITLTVERRPLVMPALYPPQADPPPEEIVLRVTDTGIGITPDQAQYLFKAFTQADGSTTRRYGGAGLGLTICQHFCRMMGGHLTVESVLGQGSIFTVYLPAQVTGQATLAN